MMNRRMFVLSSCASLLALRRAEAQTVNLSDESIRDILRRRIDVEHRATGMAVGIVERGRRRVIVYGKQDSGDAQSVAANTLFEIGSLTKVFTALLLADMVHRKEWGHMAALRGNKIVSVPLAEAIASNRKVDPELIEVANGILDKLVKDNEPAMKR